MKTDFTKKLGTHRGGPRLYFQEANLHEYGFAPGVRYDVIVEPTMVVIRAKADGKRAVCKKKVGERVLSIIDLNSNLEMFRNHEMVRVRVAPGLLLISALSELQ